MRKFIVGAIVLFIAYFLVTNPEGAASIVETAWNAVVSFFESVLDFIGALFS
jgi:cell shape-determining protein MreC